MSFKKFKLLIRDIKKGMKKEVEVKHTQLEIIFLAVSFISLAFIEVVTTAYNNTLEPLPKYVNLLTLATLISLVTITLLLLLFSDLKTAIKIWVIFLISIIYIGLVANYYYVIPKSYLYYSFDCPSILEPNSKIQLTLENKGKIISQNRINITFTESNVIYYNSKLTNGIVDVLIFPNDKRTDEIKLQWENKINKNISIASVIQCNSRFSCFIIRDGNSEDGCFYNCVNNTCRLIA